MFPSLSKSSSFMDSDHSQKKNKTIKIQLISMHDRNICNIIYDFLCAAKKVPDSKIIILKTLSLWAG